MLEGSEPFQLPCCTQCGRSSSETEVQRDHTTREEVCRSCYLRNQTSRHSSIEKGVEKSSERSIEPPSEPSLLLGHLSGGNEDGFADTGLDKIERRAEYLGIPGPKKGLGPCVLPGHRHRAGLIPGKSGWQYYCEVCDRAFGLAEVLAIKAYANIPYGDEREARCKEVGWRNIRPPSRRVEVSRWAELLDYRAGLLDVGRVEIHIPEDLSAVGLRLAEAIRLFLGLRDREKWLDEEFTFARRFIRARTGLSDTGARGARFELEQRRVIVPVGKAGRATTFRLGRREEVLESLEATKGNQEDLAAAVLRVFPGSERLEPRQDGCSERS